MSTSDLPDEWEIEGAWSLYGQASEIVDQYVDGLSASDVNHDSPEYPRDHSEEAIPVGEIEPLVQLTELLNQYQRTAYGTELSERIDASPTILNKIIHRTGYLKPRDALRLLDGFRLLLTDIENSHAVSDNTVSDLSPPIENNEFVQRVPVEKWVVVDQSEPVVTLIEELNRNLEHIILLLQQNNSLADLDSISQLRMARLKAMLETSLKLLDAPMMENGLLRATGEFTSNVAKEFAKDELKKGLGQLLNVAGEQLLKLYVILTERPPT
ncbi:hypothetical protein [Hyphomonas sp.]|uniref:hypothetical protein n=1 Tax=Hyphomonas sp. TaxID=87 RepID=UPI00300357A6